MTWSSDERVHLSAVIDAARRELRDRDPDGVPAKLRKVAASSARTLPPPLEKALVDGLVADEDFRDTVADRLDGTSLSTVSEMFLEDPAAANELARDAVRRDSDAADGRAAKARQERIGELERQLAEAKDRVANLRDRHADDLARQRDADRSARERLAKRTRAAEDEADELRRSLDGVALERDRLLGAVSSLRADLDEERTRSRAAASTVPSRTVTPTGPVPTDPGEFAALLDRLERTARPYRHADANDLPAGTVDTAMFPPGVTPDTVEAVEHLGGGVADLIVIDGYNLAGLVTDAEFHGRDGRHRVETIATALRRHTGAKVMVVFDAVDIEGRRRRETDLGVEIVFSRDRSADDEIVDIAGAHDARTVVVTDDRELRERVAQRGASVLWSRALADWSNP